MNVQELIDAINQQWEERLDKIRAEIEQYQSDAFYSDNVMINKRTILEIIDKYKTESEDMQ